ncbi:MAG: NAD(P)/FAD-dependent oxidoreductase [Leptospirales bacterium]|nr:NAD(P)/FAD-dependent oxidoreductase [Leptospirales bacterium]
MTPDFDAIVVGAGPGGSNAARKLVRSGWKTLMLDRQRFPRLKICAGWITPPALKLLDLKPGDYPHTIQPFASGSVVLNDKYYVTDFPTTASYGIIRTEFDAFLAKRAESEGATFLQDVRIKAIERVDGPEGYITVRAENGQSWTARLIIGAGGTGCPVARQWGEKSKEETIIQATESETRIGADVLKKLTPYYGTTELFPEPDFYGYAWYVTKGDWLNIGIGRFSHKTRQLDEHRQPFMELLRKLGRLNGIEDQLVGFGRHAYKLYDEVPRKLFGDRFMLIGDAGGFASKWAGEGIRPAIETGAFAAAVADEALRAGRFDAQQLSKYRQLCDAAYGEQKQTRIGSLLSNIPASLQKSLGTMVCKSAGLRKKLIFEVAFGFEPVTE